MERLFCDPPKYIGCHVCKSAWPIENPQSKHPGTIPTQSHLEAKTALPEAYESRCINCEIDLI